MIPPPIVVTDLGDLTRYLAERLDHLENLMATKQELTDALARLQTAVTAKVSDVSAQLTAMQGTLDKFVSDDATEDAAFQAQIDDLKAQLQSQLNDAVTAVDALTQSMSQTP